MCLEGTNETLEQDCSFPITVAVDAGPQHIPGASMQVLSLVPQEMCTYGHSVCFCSHLPFWARPLEECFKGDSGAALGEQILVLKSLHTFST